MITISKTALNANASEYFRRVEEDGEVVMVTEDQVPVFKMVPLKKFPTAAEVFADVRGKVKINCEDVLAQEMFETSGTVDDVFRDARGKIKYYADPMDPETEEWGDV